MKNKYTKRDYLFDIACIKILFYTGIRAYELVNLKLADIDFTNNTIFLSDRKGGKTKTIGLSIKLKPILQEYLSNRGTVDYDYFFILHGKPLCTAKLSKRIGRILRVNGIKGACHAFRRGFITTALEKNIPTVDVQYICSHKDIRTTMSYFVPDEKRIVNSMSKGWF